MQRSLQSSGSNLRIVGWMHSHPGFGVFSAFDKQHERLFNRPWQIAYVIDAQLGERALYLRDHAWRELPGYYICGVNTAHRVIGKRCSLAPKSGISVAVHSLSMRRGAGVSVG